MAVKNERYKKRDVGNNGARSFQIKHFLLSKPQKFFIRIKNPNNFDPEYGRKN